MNALKSRLNAHFAACATAAAAAAVAAPQQADAGTVYSGPVNITIPDSIDGVYMNIVSGATGASGGSVAGWDINPYSASAGGFHLWGFDATTWLDYNGTNTFNLPVGTPIGPGGSFERPGGGQNLATQVNLNSNNNFFGFEFVNENGGGTHYGFIQVAFGATAGTRSIVAYAYDDVAGAPITTFAVPAPGALALLGLAGLVGSRRRRVA